MPLIASATTDWRYVPMQEIRELCRVGDTQKPNFLSLAIRTRAISETFAEPGAAASLTAADRLKLDAKLEDVARGYYDDNWQAAILRMLRFQRPHVANVHKMTKFSIETDPTQKIYAHVEFLKPGKQVYCVSYKGEQDGALSHKRDFYVHDLMVNFRNERVPTCKSSQPRAEWRLEYSLTCVYLSV